MALFDFETFIRSNIPMTHHDEFVRFALIDKQGED